MLATAAHPLDQEIKKKKKLCSDLNPLKLEDMESLWDSCHSVKMLYGAAGNVLSDWVQCCVTKKQDVRCGGTNHFKFDL